MALLPKKRKQPPHLLLIRLPSILANLKCLRVLNLLRSLLAVTVGQLIAEALGDPLVAPREVATDLLAPFLLLGRIVGYERGRTKCAAFVELRFQRIQCIELLFNYGINRHRDVRLER